jgi:diamine N-acetyltransferase
MSGSSGIPLLRGERVFLRASERSDIPAFVRWFNDDRVTRYLAMVSPLSHAAEERWFDRMQEEQGKSAFHFVICVREDSRPIGTIGLFDVDRHHGSAGIGVSLGEPDLWGRGLGTEAMDILVAFGFGELRLERMWLHVYDYNRRGRRAYEKSGFSLEGTLRRAIYTRGAHRGVHVMSILRDEWAARAGVPWDPASPDA